MEGVKSSFEVGESSGIKNLINDFNIVEDNFSSESDTSEQGIHFCKIVYIFISIILVLFNSYLSNCHSNR